ncbi:MAG TPA: hypothetical protein VF611_11435, partial [Pyrinomonadaceae bacterium]
GDELRGRESLRALVRGLGKVEAPVDFDYRLRARMASRRVDGRRGPLRGLRLVYAFAPVAAAACFLIVSTALYLRQASRPTPAQAPAAVAASGPARNAPAEQPAAIPAGGAVEGSRKTSVAPAEVASLSATRPARPVVHRARAASRPPGEVAARLDGGAGVQRNTTIASLSSARVITGRGVPFALKTPAEPMRMILRDERGAGRVVPMRAVSFGSQELIAGEGVSRQATAAENEGVW